MKKKMKKALLAIMAVLMLFPGNNLNVEAADNTWTFEDGVLAFTGTGKITEDFYEEVAQEDIKKVIIGEGITEIEMGCFGYCYNMEEVIFPESLKKIGTQAFDMCYALKEVTIPAGVEKLGLGAFGNCEALDKITLLCDGEAMPYSSFDLMITDKETLVYMNEIYLETCSPAMFRGRRIYLNIENGDVNGDKIINANDALEMLKFSANMTEGSFLMNMLGDMTGDKVINANDALAVLKYVARI